MPADRRDSPRGAGDAALLPYAGRCAENYQRRRRKDSRGDCPQGRLVGRRSGCLHLIGRRTSRCLRALRRIRARDPDAEKGAGRGAQGERASRCHDRRRRERHSRTQGGGLLHCHGGRRGCHKTGGAADAPGREFREHAADCRGGAACRGQYHARGVALPRQDAVFLRLGAADAAVPGRIPLPADSADAHFLADNWSSGVPADTRTESGAHTGQFPAHGADAGDSRRGGGVRLRHGGNGGREFRLGYGGLQDAGGAVRGRGRADDALFRLRPADEAARGGVRRHDRRIRAGGVLFQADFLF